MSEKAADSMNRISKVTDIIGNRDIVKQIENAYKESQASHEKFQNLVAETTLSASLVKELEFEV